MDNPLQTCTFSFFIEKYKNDAMQENQIIYRGLSEVFRGQDTLY